MRVFFSHASRDKPLLREIRRSLPHHVQTWIDEREIRIGTDLEETLRTAIHERTDFVVLFVGPESARSQWVQQELIWALDRERKTGRRLVLPVLLDKASWSEMPEEIKARRYLPCTDFSEAGVRAFAQRLSDELFAWLSAPPEEDRGFGTLLDEQDIRGRRDRVQRIASAISDQQADAEGDELLTEDRLELLVSSLEPFRRLELLCMYELQRGRFRQLASQESEEASFEALHKVQVDCRIGENRPWTVELDLSTEALRPLREDYDLGDQHYIVREVFLDALEKLSEHERLKLFSNLELCRCTFLH